ncbi:MAG: hypothetical protein ACI9TB_001119 [Parasphingorhabdus sp.]|jgi:hypothetical protein
MNPLGRRTVALRTLLVITTPCHAQSVDPVNSVRAAQSVIGQ